MLRKLISFDAFSDIEGKSLSNAGYELAEASDYLSEILDKGELALHCYNANNVYYQTNEGSYVHAEYKLNNNEIELKNIEEVVIDEETQTQARRKLLHSMLESLMANDKPRATESFRSVLEMMVPKMKFLKGEKDKSETDKKACNVKSNLKEGADAWGVGSKDTARSAAAKKGHRNNPNQAKEGWKKRRGHKSKIEAEHRKSGWKAADRKVNQLQKAGQKRVRIKGKRYDEMALVADQALQYIEATANGPIMEQVQVRRDDLQNVVAVKLPTSAVRNEGKLLSIKWDTLKTDVKTLREQAQRLASNEDFQKAIASLKRSNNMSENDRLEESLHNIVGQFPHVLYLTQAELAKTIGEALSLVGTSNYDDRICNFMAEGILQTAMVSYPDRVARIASLANANVTESEDRYAAFQDAVKTFYPSVDEKMTVKRKVFEDLHSTFMDLRREALEIDAEVLRKQANDYIAQLEDVLEGKAEPSLALAEEAAAYIKILGETNLDSQEWDVVKTPYRTTVGEHPDMVKKANTSYKPSADFSGDWGDVAPVSDGKNYKNGAAKEMRNKSWGQEGGKDVYPSLDNPVVPKAGEYTMKGEPGVDKNSDSGLGQWQSGDTYPSMDNPYLPKSVRKYVNSDNRVDDVENRVGLSASNG